LEKDPKKRITAKEALCHAYFVKDANEITQSTIGSPLSESTNGRRPPSIFV
jgi:hypothetical protein